MLQEQVSTFHDFPELFPYISFRVTSTSEDLVGHQDKTLHRGVLLGTTIYFNSENEEV